MSYDLENTHESLSGRFTQIFIWHIISSLAVHTILGLRLAFNFRKDLGDKVSLIAILAFPLVNLLFIIPSGAMTYTIQYRLNFIRNTMRFELFLKVQIYWVFVLVYDSSDQPMPNWNAIVAGMLITMVNIVIGYTQID